MKKKVFKMISFVLAALMLMTSVPADVAMAAEAGVVSMISDQNGEDEGLTSESESLTSDDESGEELSEELSEEGSSSDEFESEEASSDEEMNSEDVSSEETSSEEASSEEISSELEEELNGNAEEDEFEFVPNNGILDLDIPKVDWSEGQNTASSTPYYLNEDLLGASSSDANYDARNSNLITSVKNQKDIGTCWAFATVGAMEANIMKNYGSSSNPDLSEYQLAYFMYKHNSNSGAVNPMGLTSGDYSQITGVTDYTTSIDCGGDPSMACMSLMNWKGITSESKVPYPNSKSQAQTVSNNLAYDSTYHVGSFYMADMTDSASVKQMILDYGAVASSYFSTSDGSYYNSGSYYYSATDNGSNHGILIVGWDDNYSKTKFSGTDGTPASNGAWIVKNSWGTSPTYLQNGYFYMSYCEGSLLSSTATAVTVDKADKYDKNYSYDGNAGISAISAATNYAAVYTATSDKDEYVNAVSFATMTPNVSYTVKVYTGLADTVVKPNSGQEKFSASGTTTYTGYYTVEIPYSQRVKLEKGKKFSVVVTFGKNTDSIMIATNKSTQGGYTNVNVATPGTNFLSNTGNTWTDFSNVTGYSQADFRIKAYTTEEEPLGSFNMNLASTQATSFSSPTKNVLTWSAVTNAVKYNIYAATEENGDYTCIGSATNTTYTDKLTIGSVAKYYYVEAINSADRAISVSNKKASKDGKLSLSNITATLSATDGSIQVSIPQVTGATNYSIDRKTDNGSYTVIQSGSITGTSWKNSKGTGTKDVQSGYYYTYRLRLSKGSVSSEYSNEVTVFSSVPKITSVNVSGSKSVTVTWEKDGRTEFNLYQVDGSGKYINGGSASTSATSRKIDNLTPGTQYKFALYATKTVSGITKAEKYSEPVTIAVLSTPGNFQAEIVNSYSKLTWTAVTGATKYDIYRSETENDEYTKIGSATSTEYTDSTSGIIGKDYYYKIQAMGSGNSMSYFADSTAVHSVRVPVVADLNSMVVKKKSVEIPAASAYVSYAIRLKGATTELAWKNKPTDSQSVIFNDLTETTDYTVYAKAINAADSTAVSVDIKTKGNEVVLKTKPTASSITYGQSLSVSQLTGGVFTDAENTNDTIEGTISWVDGTQILTAGTQKVNYKFVPTDKAYPEYIGEVEVVVSQAVPNIQVNKEFYSDSSGVPYIKYIITVSNPYNGEAYPTNMYVRFDIGDGGNYVDASKSEAGVVEKSFKMKYLNDTGDSIIKITIKDNDGNFEQKIYTETINISVLEVTLNQEKMELTRGESGLLTVTTVPVGALAEWTATSVKDSSIKYDITYNEDRSIATVWDSKDTNVRKAIVQYNLKTQQLKAIGDSDVKDIILTASVLEQSDSLTVHIYVPVERVDITYDDGKNAENGITLSSFKEIALQTVVYPLNADEKGITFSSSDESVANVADNKLYSYASGNAVITASTKDGISVTIPVTVTKANCTGVELFGQNAGANNTITLDLQENSSETLSVKATLDDNGSISYVTKANRFQFASQDANVASVSSEGIITAVGTGSTKVFAYFIDNMDCYGEVTVEVTGTEVPEEATTIPKNAKLKAVNTKFYLDCGDSKANGEILVTADNAEVEAKDLKFSSSNSDIVIVSETGTVTMNPSYIPKGKDVTVTVTAALRGDAKNRKVTVKVTVSGKPLVKAMALKVQDTTETIAGISRKFNKNDVLHLQAVPFSAGNVDITESVKLKWTISDTSVATVRVTGATTADITVKKAGSCAITVTSPDTGKYARTWNVFFVDTDAKVDTKALTVNKLMSTNATEDFEVITNYGMQVVGKDGNSGITVDSVKKGKTVLDASKFTVVETTNGYALQVDETTLNSLANGTYEVSLSINTNGVTCDELTGKTTVNGDDLTSTCAVKLTVVSKAPTVKINTVKMNRFYKSELTKDAGITSTNGDIADITITEETSGFGEYFSYSNDNMSHSWQVSLKLNPNNETSYTAKSMSGTVQITVDGYKPITKKVTIQTPLTKPSLAVVGTPIMQVNAEQIYAQEVKIQNKSMKDESVVYMVNSGYSNSDKLEVLGGKTPNTILVSQIRDVIYKNTTVKTTLVVRSDAWNDTANLPLQVKFATADPKIVMKKNSAQLSKNAAGELVVLPFATDRSCIASLPATNWKVQLYDNTSKKYQEVSTTAEKAVAENNGFGSGISDNTIYLLHGSNDNRVAVGLCNSDVEVGTYKYRISNVLAGYEAAYTDITVKVTNTAVTANASGSGSINILDRTTYINGKIAMKNSSAVPVRITSLDSNYEVREVSGNTFKLYAVDGATIGVGKQMIDMQVTLHGGKVINTTMSFTTKQAYPTFKTPAVQTLRKSHANGSVRYNLDDSITGGAELSAIEFVNPPKGITCKTLGNSVVLSISDGAIKPGTYKCTVNMYFEGATMSDAYPNGKPLTKVISVKVVE